jgi:tetratricopeptide (TPR) repeat protein
MWARGNVYYQLKDMTKAIEDAKTALVIDPENVKAQFLLANCYDDLNLLDQALPYYSNAIQLDSKNPTYYLRRAIVYGKMQQFSSCLQDLEACTNLDANYAEAYYWKGVVKVNMKQNPCADLRKAVDLGFAAAQQPLLDVLSVNYFFLPGHFLQRSPFLKFFATIFTFFATIYKWQ